jgi:cytochrome c oxidase cbb3-type subunit 3
MRTVSAIIGVVSAVGIAACGRAPHDLAAASAPPVMRTAVGPVPGPPGEPPRPLNPFATDRGARVEGRELFIRFNCSGCHGGHAGGGMGPSLRDVDWLYGASDAQIFGSIAEGRAHGMPAWGVHLNDDQIWKLVAYIKTLRTPDEADPPS